ncbi:hypothetical protein BpHYR1_048666 [Brachionus plicatilis]|uniref:Uncharacterized protein n=1 Tax=Brachionus plicatilis TaxID=10195 RepID=A0A3M7Q0Y8_BRAPC|nr:hypothetical protein BpHYR1_048666 [Brachionus plicatilis]
MVRSFLRLYFKDNITPFIHAFVSNLHQFQKLHYEHQFCFDIFFLIDLCLEPPFSILLDIYLNEC